MKHHPKSHHRIIRPYYIHLNNITIIQDLKKRHQRGCVDKYSKTVRERYRNGSVKNTRTVNRYDVTPTISTNYIKSSNNILASEDITDTDYLTSQQIRTVAEAMPDFCRIQLAHKKV